MSLLELVHEELRRARGTLALARLVKRTEMSASTLLRELHALSERLGGDAGFVVMLDESANPPSWRIQSTPSSATQFQDDIQYYYFDSYQRPFGADMQAEKPQKHDERTHQQLRGTIAAEAAVALVFNGISHAVLMASPAQLDDLARGFAWSEGIVDAPDEVRSIEVRADSKSAWLVEMEISARHFERLKAARRTLAGPTGCGLCGIESLEMFAALSAAKVATPAWLARTEAETAQAIVRATTALPDHQPRNAQTGALHAAAWCAPDGEIICVREDVGRHNALDKLLGAQSRSLAQGFVLMSSRASVELVRKCARTGVPLLAAVSAPTTLAIESARHANIQLWAFARQDRVTRYA